MSQSVLFDAPGPRARRRHLVLTVLSVVVLLLILLWVLSKLQDKGNLDGDKWSPFLTAEIWDEYLLPGIWGTLKAAAISIVLALVLGMAFGIGRLSTNRPVRWVCATVVEFFRAVPVLLMMLFAYGLYARFDVFPAEQLALAAVVTGLVPYNGSVVAELVRSGIGGLPRGQKEAGEAIGLTPGQVTRSILLPQALTAMLPSLVSQLVVVLKDTALGYIVTYEELLRKVEQIANYKANMIPTFLVVMAIYIAINSTLTFSAGRLEKRLRTRGRSVVAADPVVQPEPTPV